MNVQVDDGSLPFVGFEVFKRPGTVLVSILREDCRTGSVLQQEEVGFKIRVAIRVILVDTMAFQMLLGSKIEAIGKQVPGGLPTGSVAGPAGGVVPAVTIPRRVDVDVASFEKSQQGGSPIRASKEHQRTFSESPFFPSSLPLLPPSSLRLSNSCRDISHFE